MKKRFRTVPNVLERELNEFLRQLEDTLEVPLIALAFVWLVLLVVEFIWGLTPLLQDLVTVIWIIFILDFALRFFVAPRKIAYLKNNWLTALSLFLPALRLFRAVRALRLLRVFRTARGLRLVRVVGSMNRGMRALRASMNRRGISYVAVLTVLVVLVGAAGIYAFESNLPDGPGLDTYADALWWTAMLLTSIGSEYWPRTPEGRLLCLLLATYGLGILGYITATLASYFVGRDAEDATAEVAGEKSLEALRLEIRALRDEVRRLSEQR